jgi:membrane protease YdiL (CAAX protease family)
MGEPGTNREQTPNDSCAEPSLEFAAASQPSYARILFFGPGGLRAGWGFALYVLVFLLLQRLTNWWLIDWVRFSPHMRPRLVEALSELAGLIAALVPAIVLARIEKRRWACYGLPLRRALAKLFCIGVIWGFLAITALILALYGFHEFSFGQLALHGLRVAKYAAYWSGMFLLVGLFEEFLLRGYTQFTLARGIGFWPAAVVLSATFGLVHLGNEGEHWPGLLAAACIGLFFCLTLQRTGNLWFAVGFHAAWDWGETFFYSVPDSGLLAPGHLFNSSLHGSPWLTGGTVGPEGSVLCFIVIALTWIVFERTYPPQKTSNKAAIPIQD